MRALNDRITDFTAQKILSTSSSAASNVFPPILYSSSNADLLVCQS